MGSLDAFEEAVILVDLACCGFLVGMVAEDLLAVGFLDLLVGGFVAVFGKAEDGVVILSLRSLSAWSFTRYTELCRTFQSFASRASIKGSSGSLISPSSSSSDFLTLDRASAPLLAMRTSG